MKHKKEKVIFFLFFAATFLFFLYPLVFMQKSFLYGDSFVQFFPWLKQYSHSLKHFSFPFWVKNMQSGFPLMAEGQIGGFYLLNLLLFFILPFKVAYNYAILIHFLIAGIGTYFYCRTIRIERLGSYIASVIFCFGGIHAGAFYNIVTLRVLAWFPVALLLYELYFKSQKKKYLAAAGCIWGLQLLAGFIQMALYSFLFYAFYVLYRGRLEKFKLKRSLSIVALNFIFALLISLPQILLTYQLANFSFRAEATLGFALWRSFSPLGLLNSVFPYSLRFINTYLYVGIFSIFFIMVSLSFLRKEPLLRVIFALFLLSFFLALGKYNPFYVLILKVCKFYAFRVPEKFLFFANWSLSILTGYGVSLFLKSAQELNPKKITRYFRLLLLTCAGLFVLAYSILLIFKEQIIKIGSWYATNFIYNKPHHRHSLSSYLEKVTRIYESTLAGFSFSNAAVIFSWVLIIAALTIFIFCVRRRLHKAVIALIMLDIAFFNLHGSGFQKNLMYFSSINPDHQKILQKIKADAALFRILPFGVSSQKLPQWAMPNASMIYGLDSVASYTPLAFCSYRERLKDFELVDDSLGLNPPEAGALSKNSTLMRLLNVKYVISSQRLTEDFLEFVIEDEGVFLYQLKDYLPRVFFSLSLDEPFDLSYVREFEIVKYDNGFLEVKLNAQEKGFLIFSEVYYPGWKAYIDGTKVSIIKVSNLVQAVSIDEGKHSIIFKYTPSFFNY